MKIGKHIRVLVLDGDMVPALTITRSLARRHCLVDAASHISKAIVSYSSSVLTHYLHPDPLSREGEFIEWLVKHVSTETYDLIIPVTERTLVPVSRNRDRFEHVKIAMPSQKSLEVALDKARTLELATRLGVPVPVSASISCLDELNEHFDKISYPVVIKPARSLASNDSGSTQLNVSYAYSENELRAACVHGLLFGPVLLQEYFLGKGVGIELIARQGKIEYAFQHLRLHEVPLSGGGSSLRMSVQIQPKLLAAAERLMSALAWNGVAMVEFKWNPDTGNFSLMEINGRFWGSLPLADAAGADFPSMLLDLELSGEVGTTEPYRFGIYCRKLSADLDWYEAVLRGGAESDLADIPAGLETVKQLGLLFSPRHYFDVQSFRDPMPGLVDIGRIIGLYYRRASMLTRDWLFLSKQKRAWRRGVIADALKSANSILFVCYGNINRSALADLLSRDSLHDIGVKVSSAGFHQESGRPADALMIELAGEHGFDLSQLRSTTLTADMLHEHDVIFVMEKSHYDRLECFGTGVIRKTWLLGAHEGGSTFGPEIVDPFGRSRQEYRICYNRIDMAATLIKSILARETVTKPV